MKKVVLFLALVSLLFVSCNDDDDDVQKNYFKVGDTEYDILAGAIENYGESGDAGFDYDGKNLDLTLYSSGLAMGYDELNDPILKGKGHGIFFEMFSSSSSLIDQEYVYTTSKPYAIGTFDDGGYVINYNSEVEGSGTDLSISSGKVTVKKNGNEYEITISCKDELGNDVSGFYKGVLVAFDYTSDLKSTEIKPQKTKRIFK